MLVAISGYGHDEASPESAILSSASPRPGTYIYEVI
jgi:hypothetical protein